MTKKKTKAIIYCRFSPRRNGDDCESIEHQLEQCRRYCRKKGYEIVAEFDDPMTSGASRPNGLSLSRDEATIAFDVKDRPGLWRAVDEIMKGMVLVVWRLDRLARDVFLSEVIHAQARRGHWLIEAVKGHQPDNTPEQVMMRVMLSAYHEYERKLIAARTRETMQSMARGGRLVGNPRYGYEYSHSETVQTAQGKKVLRYTKPCPGEQAIIAQMRDFRARGATILEITEKLNRTGVKPRKGKKWHLETVRRILLRDAEEGGAAAADE